MATKQLQVTWVRQTLIQGANSMAGEKQVGPTEVHFGDLSLLLDGTVIIGTKAFQKYDPIRNVEFSGGRVRRRFRSQIMHVRDLSGGMYRFAYDDNPITPKWYRLVPRAKPLAKLCKRTKVQIALAIAMGICRAAFIAVGALLYILKAGFDGWNGDRH